MSGKGGDELMEITWKLRSISRGVYTLREGTGHRRNEYVIENNHLHPTKLTMEASS